jgi:uncharacterized membrane protein
MTVANPPLTSRRALGVVSAAFAALVALALLLPTIRQDAQYHLFADQRAWLGVPRAADVLSNLAFIAVGLFGVLRLSASRRPHFGYATEASLWCIAVGFVFTGLGSAWYHLQPNDATLVWDRLPMTIVFAGLFGAGLAERVSARCGLAVLLLMLAVGPLSVFYWAFTTDLSLYAVVQFGGMAALLLLLSATQRGHDPFPWWTLIAWYGVAKLLEAGDLFVWSATREVVAGHMLKHVTAALGGLAIANVLRRPTRP